MLLPTVALSPLVRAVLVPLTAVAVSTAAVAGGTDASSSAPAVPMQDHGGPALEAAAIGLAHDLRAVPADEDDRLCARQDLRVRWSAPVGFTHGAHVMPIGPAPDQDTVRVNGVVVCGVSTWAYFGFEASRGDGAWSVTGVPYVEETDGHGHNLDAAPVEEGRRVAPVDGGAGTPDGHDGPGSEPVATAAPVRDVPTSAWLAGFGAIEPYARYEPQTSCSPTAKPGTSGLRTALLGAHPVTRDLGIARACHLGGRSEHKEGRAFDWGAYTHRPVERAAVDRFLTQLLATDADGNRHALARRLGVMYVIWDGRMWSAYRAADGWRAYRGPSPHTDHLHVSLSWDGAMGRTSFTRLGLAAGGVFGDLPAGADPLLTAPADAAVPVTPPAVVTQPGHDSAPAPPDQSRPEQPRHGQEPPPRHPDEADRRRDRDRGETDGTSPARGQGDERERQPDRDHERTPDRGHEREREREPDRERAEQQEREPAGRDRERASERDPGPPADRAGGHQAGGSGSGKPDDAGRDGSRGRSGGKGR